jgi:hypothetical protein
MRNRYGSGVGNTDFFSINIFFGFVEILRVSGIYEDRRGFHPQYDILWAGFTRTLLDITANKGAAPIPIGVATASGRSPGGVIKFGNTNLQDKFGSISHENG